LRGLNTWHCPACNAYWNDEAKEPGTNGHEPDEIQKPDTLFDQIQAVLSTEPSEQRFRMGETVLIPHPSFKNAVLVAVVTNPACGQDGAFVEAVHVFSRHGAIESFGRYKQEELRRFPSLDGGALAYQMVRDVEAVGG
jgi:hypothetical protein